MKMLELLRELCALRGVSGDEGAVRDYIIEKIKDHCEYTVDPLGNVIAFKKGAQSPRNKIQFSAHMDEVGFIITCIGEDGLLHFESVGGIDPAVVIGKQVLVGDRELPGVVGIKPVHLCESDERDAIPKLEKLAIDIGAASREEAGKWVTPGDRVIFDSPLVAFGSDHIVGKALDDRAGCAMMIEMILGDLPYDCYFSFTVQEETGCAGGKTAGYGVNPDIAVVLETTTAGDVEGAPEHRKVCRLGDGPVLSFMDKGTIYPADVYRAAAETAEENGIKWQYKQGVYGGNEARNIQTARGGARMLAVSLPCRYLHSPSCVLRLCDVEAAMRLLPQLVGKLAELP